MSIQSLPRLACAGVVGLQEGEPVLLGSRCTQCGEVYFPAAAGCTCCSATSMEPYVLGRVGRLWSWTIQGFQPKAPYAGGEAAERFQPYGVGYVEMPCGVKVESRLTVADADAIEIGMPMTLTLLPFRQLVGEEVVHTYAFAPAVGVGTETVRGAV